MYRCHLYPINLTCVGGWCIGKGHCECNMPECHGPNKRSCENKMCHGLLEILFNARNCQSGPKYKSVTMALHVLGSLFGLGNFYSGRYFIGLIQLVHGLSTLCHNLSGHHRRDEGCKAFLTITAIVWWFIELFATHHGYKMDGNGCPFI